MLNKPKRGLKMWWKWLPWKFTVSRLARAHGFLDPIAVLAYMRRFSQPSEVQEPVELLRAGVILHARGLMNSRAIQHNLDWIWPYWVERQFDPRDDAFIPRAFSLTHINLTHRNWTAVGIPECPFLPIVDPRGLVTPLQDEWSLDAWIVGEDGQVLAPSKAPDAMQRLVLEPNLAVETESRGQGFALHTRAEVAYHEHLPHCLLSVAGRTTHKAWLVIALRPYNPEGVSFIHRIDLEADRREWRIDNWPSVGFSEPVERHAVSEYHQGDVAHLLPEAKEKTSVHCNVGLATAAALFALEPNQDRTVSVSVPLEEERRPHAMTMPGVEEDWRENLKHAARLNVPDEKCQALYDAALRTLILHSPDDVYPGPYTYKRFWFRDAAFILHAMLCAGFFKRSERAIDHFPSRQTAFGYFHSQEGEWDSNGEALWIMARFCELTGNKPKPAWIRSIRKGAQWIVDKRYDVGEELPHAGLLPAGFSAEHLGPNDYYFWDDFWGVAGLRAAGTLMRFAGDPYKAEEREHDAADFMRAIEDCLDLAAKRLGRPAMPASPYRRLDSGAVGSIVAGYPLQLWPADNPRLQDTCDYLIENCSVNGGFFQDMIHSGVNPYLTLHLAQILLRAGDSRAFDLLQAVVDLASPTGQWPEAVHPRTGGGCMGDGQHVWASAEFVMLMRNGLVYEERFPRGLVLGAGLMPAWLDRQQPITFGPAPTSWGPLTLTVEPGPERIRVAWEADWREAAPRITIRIPGCPVMEAAEGQNEITLEYVPA